MQQPLSIRNRNLLLVITALALLIRLISAYLQPNYIDEGFNYYLCKAGVSSILEVVKSDVHTPITQLAIYPLTRLTHDIFWLRLPFVFLGGLSVGLSYFVFCYYVKENDALLLALFLAVSYSFWDTDVLMRPYGPLNFFLMIVWLGLLSFHENGCPLAISSSYRAYKMRWLLFFLACLGAASFHCIGVLVLAACAFSLFFSSQKKKYFMLSALILGVIPSVLWFVWGPVQQKLSSGPVNPHATHTFLTAVNIPAYIFNLDPLRGLLLGRQELWAAFLQNHALTLFSAFGGVIFVLCIYGTYAVMRENRWKAGLAFCNVVIPVGVLLFAAKAGFLEMFYLRYALPIALPLMCLLLNGCGKTLKRAFYALSLSAAAVICICYPFHNQLWNQYWESTFAFIEKHQQRYDLIFVNIPYTVYSFSMAYNCENIDYAFSNNQVSCTQTAAEGKLPVYTIAPKNCSPSLVDQLGPMRIFLVLCESGYEDDYVLKYLMKYYRVVDAMEYTNLHYWGSVRTLLLERQTQDD